MGDENKTPSGGESGAAGATGAEGGMNKGGAGAAGGDGPIEEVLQKSMAALEAIVQTSPEGRRQALLQKAIAGGCSADENAELMKLLGGEQLGKSLTTSVAGDLAPSNDLTKSLDISPFIDHLNENLTKAVVSVADHVEKSEARHQEQIVVLAKGLMDLGKLVSQVSAFQKSFAADLAAALRLPARGPRAVGAGGNGVSAVQGSSGAGGALEKSMGGQQPQGEQLSKSDVNNLLSDMLQESLAKGRHGLAECGEDIGVAAAQFEQFNEFPTPQFRAEVISFAKSRRQQQRNGRA